jgi:26 proteasome complex subunit DSS1
MSSAATTSKPEDEIKPTEPQKEGDEVPHLSVLEEDDEFEEFPVQGERPHATVLHYAGTSFCFRALAENTPTGLDWDDSQTDLAHLGGVAPGAAKSEGDKLWEDNWDDDDIEEEFSVQLR